MYEIDILGFLMSNIEIIGPALSCALDCEFMVWTLYFDLSIALRPQ